ncbi:MAG: PAS domain-containing protein [Azospirillum sp.]|nr:PAS domain-containing protein [Azospirillum sp.]
MAQAETFETGGGIAVVELPGGDAGKARLVWGDALFHAEFPDARGGAACALGDDPLARGKFAAALNALAPGATAAVACEGDWLFGRDVVGILRAARLGPTTWLLSFPFAADSAADAQESRIADALDGLPIAVAICAADEAGRIMWINEAFRQLMGGADFDLIGTPIGERLAMPGTYATVLAATGPFVPSVPFPTAIKTLDGMMAPAMISAKRGTFRGEAVATVCLARGI